MSASVLHQQVEAAFNAGDLDALVGLYEPDARMVREDGSVAEGLHEIRELWSEFVALGGRISMTTRFCVEAAGTALLSNAWTFEGAGMSFSSATSEVARSSPDGAWRYIIDNPFGAASDPE